MVFTIYAIYHCNIFHSWQTLCVLKLISCKQKIFVWIFWTLQYSVCIKQEWLCILIAVLFTTTKAFQLVTRYALRDTIYCHVGNWSHETLRSVFCLWTPAHCKPHNIWSKVWLNKNVSKQSCVLLLYLLSFLSNQTLCEHPICKNLYLNFKTPPATAMWMRTFLSP